MKILLLEDNSTDADMTKIGLLGKIPDCSIEHASTLEQARKFLNENDFFDIALLDVKLPDGNGIEFLMEIRQQELNFPVIMLTGSGDEESAVTALKLGADDYVIKRSGYISNLPNIINFTISNFKKKELYNSEIIDVLYIEHHIVDIDLSKRHLAQYAPNIRIEAVLSAEEALLKLANDKSGQNKYKVILMDYRLPGMNALDLIKTIRQNIKLNIPIILVTGQGNEELAVQVLKLGADDYITKGERYLFRLPAIIINTYQKYELVRKQEALIIAKEKAEESNRLKTAFLQNISHEIRTPMNGILGFLGLLKNPNLTNENQEKYITIVEKSGKRLLTTINDLIEVSKIDSGTVELTLEVEKIEDILQYHFNFFSPAVQNKGLSFKMNIDIDDKKCKVLTDRHKLDSIFISLINNAVKFTKKGSIEIGCYKDGTYLVFYVKDTGIGIPSDRHDAIFERFVQAELSITRGYEGSGLGLSIAKSYAELLGGKIWVDSVENSGSTFYFSIPESSINMDLSEVSDQTNAIHVRFEPGIKILIAEDEEFSYEFLKALFSKYGIETVQAENGEEAIIALKNNPDFDLILMDLKMTVMNGLAATREIRKFNKNIPIIAQTAYAFDSDKEIAIEAGCNDYISKPINESELIYLVERYLKKGGSK